MPQKTNLSREDIQEIQSLRGKISAEEAKKKFGIGSTRLYKLWHAAETNNVIPVEEETNRGSAVGEEKTIEDVYDLLRKTEMRIAENNILQKENKDLSVEILSRLDTDEEDNIVGRLLEEIEDTKEDICQEKEIYKYYFCPQGQS